MQNCVVVFFFVMLAQGCNSSKKITLKTIYKLPDSSLVDYSRMDNWAAHPWKWDPSDSIPAPYKKYYLKDSIIDVFFLHPTSHTVSSDPRWNASIYDSAINHKTDYRSILYQASAFSEKARLFAPRYRQAHIRSYFTSQKDSASKAIHFAYEDVKAAFLYYLQHYNTGRPFILAAHSQGTTHAIQLIKDFIDQKPLQQQFIIAYLVGMPVKENEFNTIPVCTNDSSTGCFVSWRTYKRGYIEPAFVAKENFKAAVTNPLLWTSSEDFAPASLNSGAVLTRFNKPIKASVNANIHGNVLWTSKPRFFGNVFLTYKNYHVADINFFYLDIAENVKRRIRFYQKMQK